MDVLLMKTMKPHITIYAVLVKYRGRDGIHDARKALDETATIVGALGELINIPPGCNGCNDPDCDYDNPNGYLARKMF